MSAVSAIILGGMSESWHAFEVSIFMICFWVSLLTQENEDCDFPLCTSYSQLSILGWFLYFINAFKTGSFTWIANGWEFLYSAMLRLLTIFERKYERFFISYNLVVLSQNYFFSGVDFVRKKRFHCFPIFCPEVCWGVLSYPLFLLRGLCRKWLLVTRQWFCLHDTW